MAKCEFNKDAAPQPVCFWNSYFEGTLLSECIFFSQFKVVHGLSVSLTTDTLSKSIMDPSSVQRFSDMVSVTGEGLAWWQEYIPPGISGT